MLDPKRGSDIFKFQTGINPPLLDIFMQTFFSKYSARRDLSIGSVKISALSLDFMVFRENTFQDGYLTI